MDKSFTMKYSRLKDERVDHVEIVKGCKQKKETMPRQKKCEFRPKRKLIRAWSRSIIVVTFGTWRIPPHIAHKAFVLKESFPPKISGTGTKI